MYAPDLIDHPGRSAQTRISPSGTNYGRWFTDVLDGLGLTNAAAIGVSYGGGVLLQAATVAPRRITRAVLLAPAGIVPVSKVSLLFQLPPAMLIFKLFPNRERLVRAIRPLFMSEPEPLWVEAMGEIYKEVRLEHRMPRLVAPDELAGFTAPTLVIAGEKDVIFPAQALVERAREVIPNVVATEVLAGSGHVLSKEAITPLNFWIRRFLLRGL